MKNLVLIIVFMLTACVGTSQPSRFFTLNMVKVEEVRYNSSKMFVGVANVSVPMYLDRPQMVTRDKNEVELVISEFNRWSEPLGDAIQQALANDIAEYLPNATVKPTSFRDESFDYVVWVEVDRFDGSWGKNAVLSAWWSIFDKNEKLVLRSKIDLKRSLGKTYDDLAKQDSELIGELARQISEKLSKLKK